MSTKHCCPPIWPATYQLPMPFLAQVAVNFGEQAQEEDHIGLAYRYAEDVLDLMILTSVPNCPVRLEAFHVLEYAILDLAHVPALTRGVMVAQLGQITEFALLHCSAASDQIEFESAIQWTISEGMVGPHHVPTIHQWFAETVWAGSSSPRDEVAMRLIRDASLDQTRVAFASAWAATMNLMEPHSTVPAYRAFEAAARDTSRATLLGDT